MTIPDDVVKKSASAVFGVLHPTCNPATHKDYYLSQRYRKAAHAALEAARYGELWSENERLREALKHHEGKRAPVQGFNAGIPWDMHLQAYDAYCQKYSSQQALIEGGCRGGFSVRELDVFIPGWRDELQRRGDEARALLSSIGILLERLQRD